MREQISSNRTMLTKIIKIIKNISTDTVFLILYRA